MMPGVPERRTHTYVRHGTTSLFAALDVASGFVIGKCYKRHRAAEFLDFLKQIDAQVPDDLEIHIIMDNYATHKTPRSSVAGTAAALSCALHAHIGLLDQSGRTLVRRAHSKAAAARRSHLRQTTRGRYPRLHRSVQQEPQALQMDQVRRRNPLFRQTLLPKSAADIMQRTLDSRD